MIKIRQLVKKYKQNGGIDLKSKEKRPKDWSPDERVSALIETGDTSSEDSASRCCRMRIFFRHLDQWKKDAGTDLSSILEKICTYLCAECSQKRAADLMISFAGQEIYNRIAAIK